MARMHVYIHALSPTCFVLYLAKAARQEPLFLERLRERHRVGPVVAEGAHERVHTQLVRVAPRQKRVAGRAAHRLLGISTPERGGAPREALEVGRGGLIDPAAKDAEVGRQVIHHDIKDGAGQGWMLRLPGLLRGRRRARQQEQEEEEKEVDDE